MDKVAILLVLCLVNFYTDVTSGQDGISADLQVTIDGPEKRLVKEGDSVTLTCSLNDGLKLFLNGRVQWGHQSLASPDSKFVMLAENKILMEEGSPDVYEVTVGDSTSDTSVITFTIKKVTPEMDGNFICRYIPLDPDADKPMQKVEFVVLSEVQTIAMTFDGESPITRVDQIPVEREEGEYGVTCMAKGFNPTATIHMYVGDTELVTGGTDIQMDVDASKAAGSRRYMARATASQVQLKAKHSGQTLRCEAYANKDDRVPMEASVPLAIIALEPTIECESNNTARPSDLYVKIVCIVDHSNVEVEGYSFEIEKSGVIVRPDELTESHDEVIVEEIGNQKTKVTLDLYEVKDWHFDSYYYLDVYTKSGQRFRETTSLVKLAPVSSGPSIQTTSKSLLFAACFLISSLLLSL